MVGFGSRTVRRSVAVFAFFVVGLLALRAQHLADRNTTGVTTQQRLESELWWPTMSTSPIESYAGSTGCVACHADVSAGKAPATAMAGAASHTSNKEVLFAADASRFDSGDLHYLLHQDLDGPELSVSRGNDKSSQRLEWVMGSGELGRTFVYQRDGRWFQSRLSEYRVSPKLDVTTGLTIPATTDLDHDLAAALGKRLTTEEVRHCFNCHTVDATSSKGFNPAHAEAGVGCEACHGPGAAHVVTTKNSPDPKEMMAIFNPAQLSPADSIDFCGACHRTFGDVTQIANPANDASVVRFQPYRLEKSRCWRETEDARLTCVACHDPHLPLVREDASYDRRCLTCHRSGASAEHSGRTCPTGASKQCVSCHMQKVKVASMHGEFTDHYIHVVKAGEAFSQ